MERRPSRRAVLVAGTGLAASLAGCAGGQSDTSPTPESGTDTVIGTPDGTDTPATAEGPLQWTESLGAPTTRPAVADGTVYVGTDQGAVVALQRSDGSTQWQEGLADPIVGQPAIGDDRLFVVSGETALSSVHRLFALDRTTGEVRWTFEPEGWWLDVFGVRDGRVYVGTHDDAVGGTGETLTALDAASGDIRWTGDVGDGQGLVTDDAVYVASFGSLDAFDAADGTHRWSKSVTGYSSSTLAATAETVCYVEDENDTRGVLVGRDAATGERRWTLDDWLVTSTTLHGGVLYAGGERLAAVDPASGGVTWSVQTSGFVPDAPIRDGTLYAGGDELRATAVDDGSEIWSWTPEPAVEGVVPGAATASSVFVDTWRDGDPRNRYKFAVARDRGDTRWAFDGEAELTDLTLGSHGVVVGSDAGRVHSLARE